MVGMPAQGTHMVTACRAERGRRAVVGSGERRRYAGRVMRCHATASFESPPAAGGSPQSGLLAGTSGGVTGRTRLISRILYDIVPAFEPRFMRATYSVTRR
jgi:hypothetical protein